MGAITSESGRDFAAGWVMVKPKTHSMSKSQYGSPVILSQKNESTLPLTLKRIDLSDDVAFKYSEKWLQKIIFEHPSLLPINEIDQIFGEANLHPVCREIETGVGPLDNLYINDLGMFTLVECKLWKNPEARRKVIGQILDYAQAFCRLGYNKLVSRIKDKTGKTLFEIVSAKTEGLSEHVFFDSVVSNLKKGRFLLLVVGEGIQEETENISKYLQDHAHLNFAFALVEQCLYKIGDSDQPDILILPRVLAKTVEIERAVVRIEGSGATIEPGQPESQSEGAQPPKRRGPITQQFFFEQIEKISPSTAAELQRLIDKLLEKDLTVEAGTSGIMIKDKAQPAFNFMLFGTDGDIRNYRCGSSPLGKSYMEELAQILPDAIVDEHPNTFYSTVKRSDGSCFHIQDIIDHQGQWIALIDRVLKKISTSENNENPDNTTAG